MDNIKLELTLEEVNAVISVLAQLPFNQVHVLVDKIRTQAITQVQAANQAKEETPAE